MRQLLNYQQKKLENHKNNNHPISVLITSPSIDPDEHIGGIATFTSLLLQNNSEVNYIHFARGRKKDQKRGVMWFIKQPAIFADFFLTLIKSKETKVVHINMPLDKLAVLRDTILVVIASICMRKIILHLHGGKYSLNRSTPFLIKKIVRLSIGLSSKLIMLGNEERKYLIEYYKVKPQKLRLLYNAVKLEESIEEKQYNSTINILYLGRIEKSKGLREILLALRLLSFKYSVRLIIAGEGTEKEKFLQECEVHIPGKYEYMGVVTGIRKQLIFNKSHIFLMPSYYEGLPYSLLEAMANKLIPVVTPVGSIPEVIEDGCNGVIVPVNDYKKIFMRISELIEDPQMMQTICNNAYNHIRSRYSLRDHIKQINQIYFGLSN